MRKLVFLLSAWIAFSVTLLPAQNPIVPPGVYIADPSARVWKDGVFYIYGSRDESTDYYCSRNYHVLSTTDMINWTIHENSFSSAGENDQVPYNDAPLYAPDCAYKDGKYYLYYCQPVSPQTAGVAVSDTPTGPFLNGRSIDLGNKPQIDPNVFIDDDGQAYYLWGQFSLKIARLKPNMEEIDHKSMIDGLITEGEHYFHEGANLRKRNGKYYLIYSHMGRGNTPTAIGYSTSDSPMGPFTYGGVIVDNRGCDPMTWNNHGSIQEYNGQWYVIYHRSTHGSMMMRKACVEPIFFNEDGSIDEVEMTSQGAGPALDAFETIDAARTCLMRGNVRIQAYAPDAEALKNISNQDWAAWKYIDFDKGANAITVKVLPGENAGRIDVALDQPWSRSVGSIQVPAKADGQDWIECSGTLDDITGVRAVWLRFHGEGDDLYQLDSFVFSSL